MSKEVTRDAMPPHLAAREAHSDELVTRIARTIRADGRMEALNGLYLHRAALPTGLMHGISKPAFCVIAQGSKEILLGDHRYRYDPAHYLLATAELPIVSQIIEASAARPYLSLRLELDLTLVSSVMVETGHSSSHRHAGGRAINVSPLDANLLDAVVRLVRLLDSPTDAQFLMPLITREIIYRLLTGAQSDRLCQIAVQGGHTYRIVKAIEQLRKGFDQPLRIDAIAKEAGMSVSSFHHHFKAVTGMSPLQFQKRKRLQEARRLMLGEHLDAASTAYRVGYDDASHFSREYKRLFGEPPLRDMERLRATTWQNDGLEDD